MQTFQHYLGRHIKLLLLLMYTCKTAQLLVTKVQRKPRDKPIFILIYVYYLLSLKTTTTLHKLKSHIAFLFERNVLVQLNMQYHKCVCVSARMHTRIQAHFQIPTKVKRDKITSQFRGKKKISFSNYFKLGKQSNL